MLKQLNKFKAIQKAIKYLKTQVKTESSHLLKRFQKLYSTFKSFKPIKSALDNL